MAEMASGAGRAVVEEEMGAIMEAVVAKAQREERVLALAVVPTMVAMAGTTATSMPGDGSTWGMAWNAYEHDCVME